MHYALFVPGVTGSSPEHLRKVGLSTLADVGGFAWCDGVHDGKRGGLARNLTPGSLREAPNECSMIPHWESFDDGKWYLGWDPENPPTPADLKLPKQSPGDWVRLEDDNEWLIPYATELPKAHVLGEDGLWVPEVSARYRQFHDKAVSLMEDVFRQMDARDLFEGKLADEQLGTSVQLSLDSGADYCDMAMTVNYRICAEVTEYLDLWSDEACAAVVMASLNLSDIIERKVEKKNGLPGRSRRWTEFLKWKHGLVDRPVTPFDLYWLSDESSSRETDHVRIPRGHAG